MNQGPLSAPGCVHAPRCPGCPLIGQGYAEGLALKAVRLERELSRYPALGSVPHGDVLGADVRLGYRVRAKLVADAEGRLGLYAAGSHEVVDIPECRVLAPPLLAMARALRDSLPFDFPLSGADLRLCDEGVMVCLIFDGRPARQELLELAQRLAQALPDLAGLAASFRRPGAVQLLSAEVELLSGAWAEPHHLYPGSVWHYASHGAFTQVNAGQAARLHERIEALLAERLSRLAGARVLELYAGSGVLSLRLAAAGAKVTSVESFAPALERVASAARAQSLELETWCGDCETFLSRVPEGSPAEPFDAVIVNPPRRGLSPGVRFGLARLAPQLILYVSCEPRTFVRDLSHLRALGHRPHGVEALDMIPFSDSLECLGALVPSAPLAPEVLFEDERSVALFKPPFESVHPEGASPWDLASRARRALGLPELTPVHRLDRDTSGVCWFARRRADVPELARALARGERTYVALVHGVTRQKGKIDRPLRDAGKPQAAVTRYRRRAVIGGHSLISIWPEHGRKHQVRRHLSALHHPILGDERYGRSSANLHLLHRHGLDRTFLHCESLRVDLGAGPIEIRAELPGDLAAVLASLEGTSTCETEV